MNYEFYDVCFRYLVEKDASVAAVNNDGELPFDIAEGDEMEAFLETEMQNKGKQLDIIVTKQAIQMDFLLIQKAICQT